jgi:hypothetical protein
MNEPLSRPPEKLMRACADSERWRATGPAAAAAGTVL